MEMMHGINCKVLPLHIWGQDYQNLLWIKNSAQQDTFAAKHKKGSFSVLKIKDKGHVSSFVLDPNLTCIFWDYEDACAISQRLCAQDKNGDILLYSVSDNGVTEILRLTSSKIQGLFKGHCSGLELVGCDRGLLFLVCDSMQLYCVEVALGGTVNLKCSLKLPGVASDIKSALVPVYQIVNGSVVMLDYATSKIFIHSVSSDSPVNQIDLNTVGIAASSLLHWKISFDLSSLFLLTENWILVQLKINNYAEHFPQHCILNNFENSENAFTYQYLSFNLCRYGDSAWKQEVVKKHLSYSRLESATQFSRTPSSIRKTGFSVASKKYLHKEKVKPMLDPASKCTFSLKLTELQRDEWRLKEMEASSDVVSFVLKRKSLAFGDSKQQAIYFANFLEENTHLHSIEDTVLVTLSDKPTCCHILFSDTYAQFVSPHGKLHKDDLISWLMSYSGPSAADSLCQANLWTRTAVPIHTLESSLQQRQLDTLGFYFKSKQEVFSSYLNQSQGSLMGDVRQLEEALRLVTDTVKSSLLEPQARIFAERLLSLTLEFLYDLLEDGRQALQKVLINSDIKEEIKESCDLLMSYMPALRKCLKALQYRSSQARAASHNSDLEVVSGETLEEISFEKFVKENKVSSLQAILMTRDDKDKLHYRDIVKKLLQQAKIDLENKNIPACQLILTNLGCNVKSVLWSLSQFYVSRSLQKFISSQLLTSTSLKTSQHELLQYLDLLYKAYPQESFTLAMEQKVHDHESTWPDREDPLKSVIKGNEMLLLTHCGELTQHTEGKTSTGHQEQSLYVAVYGAWVAKWTPSMRQSVLIDSHFLTSDDAMPMFKSDPVSTWKFLLSHNLINILLPLIRSAGRDPNFPWPDNPTKYLHLCWSHMRKEIARELLRLGKLDIAQLKEQDVDINALLPTVGGIMKKPHPLSYMGSSYMKQLHIETVNQFANAGLLLPLWVYCTVHGIEPSDIKISHGPSWYPLFQAVHKIPRHPTDRNLMLSASLLAAADLWSISPSEVSVEMMLEKNQVLAALGTLCYMPENIPNLSSSLVEKHLQKYPKLMAALMPDRGEKSSKQDISVYHLLMGSTPFDVRKLFGWQSTNIFAGEDSPKTMPHFSDPALTAIYSRNQKLPFPYYIKKGRPVYAYLTFLSEESERSEAPLSLKRIHQACGAALWIACQNFNDPHVSSACVVFVELLGQDSALVRTMLHTGRVLLSHKHRGLSGATEARQEQLKTVVADIVTEMLACVKSRTRHGLTLLKSLEEAIEEEIKHEVIDRCSFDASQKWLLAIVFCQQLSLPLSTCFLRACAENDNWLMFIWFAQLHQYPTHQLQSLLNTFKSPHLRDHLHYVINNADSKWFTTSAKSSTKRQTSSDKTSSQSKRAYLYSRMGLQGSRERVSSSSEEDEEKNQHAGISSFSSRLKQTEMNECEMDEATAPDDVFRMLFYSQSMPSQWRCLLSAAVCLRNPLFAELSACCGCPALACVCGWLLASLSAETKQTFLNKHGHQVTKWTLEHLEALIDTTLSCRQEDSLATAFKILQPYSPLLPFLCFVNEFVNKRNYASCQVHIDHFKDALANSESDTKKEKISTDIATIGERPWWEKVTYQVIRHELKSVPSLYHAKHLLEILVKHNLCLIFSFDVLDFAVLYKVVTILHGNDVPNIVFSSLLTSGTKSDNFLKQCEGAVNYLIGCGKFSEAHELATLSGISREGVAISQLKKEKERLMSCNIWAAKYVRTQYWEKCKQLMDESKCSPETCAFFFQEEIEGTNSEFEKALLCQHWLFLLEKNTEKEIIAVKDSVFRKMWKHRIAAKVTFEEHHPLDKIFDEMDQSVKKQGNLKVDLVEKSVIHHSGPDVQGDLNAEELEILDTLMGNYLDDGRVCACAHVAAVFGHYNQDLAIIQTCIALANGQSSIDTIEPAMKRLIAKSSTQRNRKISLTLNRSYSIGSMSSMSPTVAETSTTETPDVISSMEKLYSHCVKGAQVCLRIITCYKIAEILGQSYENVVMSSEFDSLRKLLRINHPNKFSIARDFLATSGLSDDEIASFLADSIVDLLKKCVKGNTKSELVVQPTETSEVLSQFVHLSENTALLGNHILQSVATLSPTNQKELSSTVLKVQTELIVMAHECFTISSNMEGISHVLRAARLCCENLAAAGEFNLMIRLLTGVGRYSEMPYIFHALQQHHQFELLLRKGMDREDKLKVAILDYLKHYQPDDNDAYTMVALKFTMYRDIAGMLEACAHKSLKLLKDKPLENSKETQDLLKKCLQYYQDAAESYVKDNSVRKAQHCVKQARLLSLQLQFLANGLTIIHLSREQLNNFINTHNRFIEAMIVSDAYEKRADWAEAVFNNVVMKGDMCYLQEMKLHVHITPSLVEDVVKSYKLSPVKPTSALQPIKKLLNLCKDIQLQYRLANELGLQDVVTTLLNGDSGCYLKDVATI